MSISITLWVLNLVQAALMVLAAPLLAGIIQKCKARLQNRRGAPILQPYRNLLKLFRKETLLAENASWIFRTTPYVLFTTTALAASVVPVFLVDLPSALIADVIAMAALLALARFWLALAGMDIGTAFGGMGASREMTFSALAEPAMLMSMFVMSLGAHSTNLSTMVEHALHLEHLLPSVAFALAALLMVAIAENGRIPIDNPSTHLELTMIHEAMILEYSGRHLALIEWASQIKLLLFATLIISLFVPWGIAESAEVWPVLTALVFWFGKVVLLAVALAVLETGLVKVRLFQVPEYLSTAFVLAFLGMLVHYILEVGA
ncbi:MAG: NADH-quinone oxidoreductase subunit H [Mariprofundus sp.]|nr:NADH-quinone oxidoreductase subunit H [Mariprofundus sp.]